MEQTDFVKTDYIKRFIELEKRVEGEGVQMDDDPNRTRDRPELRTTALQEKRTWRDYMRERVSPIAARVARLAAAGLLVYGAYKGCTLMPTYSEVLAEVDRGTIESTVVSEDVIGTDGDIEFRVLYQDGSSQFFKVRVECSAESAAAWLKGRSFERSRTVRVKTSRDGRKEQTSGQYYYYAIEGGNIGSNYDQSLSLGRVFPGCG